MFQFVPHTLQDINTYPTHLLYCSGTTVQ